MDTNVISQGPHKDFENIKHIDENGIEYWLARDLMLLLGYPHWQKAEEVIGRAARACVNSGQNVDNHFNRTVKMVKIGSNTPKKTRDYKLDRYACYLIAQNGDSNKPEISLAQTYFALQTRRQEIFENLSEVEKRLRVRNQVKTQNKKLSGTAKDAGVTKFGLFYDAGYRGLYDMPLAGIKKKKGIQKGDLLDMIGTTELAANLFRITQTEEILKKNKNKVYGDYPASRVHNTVGREVRQTIQKIGGVLPENLLAEKHIKEAEKELKGFKKTLISGKKPKNKLLNI
ncbi:MAG: DNA damage-inducible protein D [bacterium]|nr:DNA damage-inducible protein D [bacterium]